MLENFSFTTEKNSWKYHDYIIFQKISMITEIFYFLCLPFSFFCCICSDSFHNYFNTFFSFQLVFLFIEQHKLSSKKKKKKKKEYWKSIYFFV